MPEELHRVIRMLMRELRNAPAPEPGEWFPLHGSETGEWAHTGEVIEACFQPARPDGTHAMLTVRIGSFE